MRFFTVIFVLFSLAASFCAVAAIANPGAEKTKLEQMHDTVQSLAADLRSATSPRKKSAFESKLQFARGMYVGTALQLQKENAFPENQRAFLRAVIAEEKKLHEASASAHEQILSDYTQAQSRNKKQRRFWATTAIAGACATAACFYADLPMSLQATNIAGAIFSWKQWRKLKKESRVAYVPASETLKQLSAIEPFWNGYASLQDGWLDDLFYGIAPTLPTSLAERLNFIRALDAQWNGAGCAKVLLD